MNETIYDYLQDEDKIECDELFDELCSTWDLRELTPEDLFQIGFARGRGVVVPMNGERKP